jgi:cytochrome c oxidase assembly protein subunit 15
VIAAPKKPSAVPAPGHDGLFASWSAATAAAGLLLLGAGGMVTSTGSGLAVPDWPLSFGTLMPAMRGGVFYEHGHRLAAGVVALMSLAQAALTLRPAVPAEARTLARWAAGLILVQALLGGLTVLMRLPPAVSIAHACLGQTVFCLLLACAVTSSRSYLELPRDAAAGRVFLLAALGLGAAFVQLGLGALLRHTGVAVPFHVLWAGVVLLFACLSSFTALRRGVPGLSGAAWLLALAVPAQLALGLAAYRARLDATWVIPFQTAALWRTVHLMGGAVTLGCFLALALKARRLAR